MMMTTTTKIMMMMSNSCGLYAECVATSDMRYYQIDFLVMMLPVPPRIPGSRTDTDLSVIVRRPIRMECEPTGVPEPEITWFKDGQIINVEENLFVRVLRGGRVLQVVAAEVRDSGVYTCNAQNIAGQERRKYKLQVHGEEYVCTNACGSLCSARYRQIQERY